MHFFDKQLDPAYLESQIFLVIYGFADPTDRTPYPLSSSDYGGTGKNTHDAATFDDKTDVYFGNVHFVRILHR